MQTQKTQMAKRQFRIGDLAKELKVKKFVIRFWEKEFDLKSGRSQGGQRFYTNDDLTIFLTIKDLLYNQGFTIAGAKKQLPEVLAGAKLAPDDSFQGLDELSQEFSTHAVQTDEGQNLDDFDEQDNERELDDELEQESFECAKSTLQIPEIAPEVIYAVQAGEPLVLIEEVEPVALDCAQVDQIDQEVSAYTQSEQQSISEERIMSEQIAQEATTIQAAQEVCFPARALPDDSFYDGLAALKEQLLRLHELLD